MLIGLDIKSTGISHDGSKQVRKLLYCITISYKKIDIVNTFKSDNIPLVELVVSYQNNGYDCGLYCLKCASILNGINDWMVMIGDVYRCAESL